MTRRSRLYFNRKWFEKHSVKIPFKHEPSFMNDLMMFGRCFGRAQINENGLPVFGYMSHDEFVDEFNKAAKSSNL